MVTLDSAKIGSQSNGNPQITASKPVAPSPKQVHTAKANPHANSNVTKTNVSDIISEKVKRTLDAQLQERKIQQSQDQEKISREILEEAADKMRKLAAYIADNTHLLARDYQVHEQTNRITVKIYDSVTGEVIREVPGTEFLDRVAKMEQLMGVIFDNLV